MIIAKFYKNGEDKLLGFEITGHAGYADPGEDIVCASVSSAAMLTCNAVTAVFKLDAKVSVSDNKIMLKLVSDETGEGDKLVLGLMLQLGMISEEFPQCIMVKEALR